MTSFVVWTLRSSLKRALAMVPVTTPLGCVTVMMGITGQGAKRRNALRWMAVCAITKAAVSWRMSQHQSKAPASATSLGMGNPASTRGARPPPSGLQFCPGGWRTANILDGKLIKRQCRCGVMNAMAMALVMRTQVGALAMICGMGNRAK